MNFRRSFLTLWVVFCLVLTACSSKTDFSANTVYVKDAPDTGALAATADGGFLYGGRSTGDIWAVDSGAKRAPGPLAHVDVSTDGQRGLLGLAVDKAGSVFVAYTDTSPTRNIQVAVVNKGKAKIIWTGPPSTDVANGGHIAFSPTGRLVIGIGDLTDIETAKDPKSLNGKMLSLDPAGPASQSPTIISGGWHNPFAFTYRSDGSLWVADNSPSDDERLARADIGGAPSSVTVISAHDAPSGLAETEGGELFVCSYTSNTLQGYAVKTSADNGAKKKDGPVAEDCATGVVTLLDGALAYATPNGITRVRFE